MISKMRTFYLLILVPFFMGCPPETAPDFPKETREKEIRTLIADIIDTPSYKRNPNESVLKKAVLEKTVAVYHIINHPEILKEAGIPGEIDSWLSPLRDKLKGVAFTPFKEALQKIELSEYQKHEESLDKALVSFKFETPDTLKKIQIPKIGETWKKFLEAILENYFIELSVEDKKRILGFLLRNTTSQTKPTEVLLALVSSSGPYFQKLMQLLGDFLEKTPADEQNADFLEIKEGLGNVKNRLPPIDPICIEKYVKELEGLGVQIKIGGSLGAASVGEVFKAEYWPNGKNRASSHIVIKLMRPEIEEIAKREETFFRAKAAQINPMMEASFAQIAEQISQELDYEKELNKLNKGGLIYGTNPSSNIRVVKPIQDFPHRKYWMAMDLGPGKTFRDSRGRISDPKMPALAAKLETMSKAILLDRFMDDFLKKVFFVNQSSVFPEGLSKEQKFAFFHGDLHSGNMLVYIDERIYSIMDNKRITAENIQKQHVLDLLDESDGNNIPYIQMIIVDFGNAHILSLSQSKALFDIFIAAAQVSLSVEAFTSSFKELLKGLSNLDDKVREDLSNKVDDLKGTLSPLFSLEDGFKEPYERVGAATDILMDNDVIIPGVIYALIRSLGMVANTYNQIKEDAKEQEFHFENLSLGDTMTWTIIRNVAPTILKGSFESLANFVRGYFSEEKIPEPDMPFSKENIWSMAYKLPSELWRVFTIWWEAKSKFSF